MKSKATKYFILFSILVVSIFIFLLVFLSKLDTDTTFKQIDLENNGVIINLAKDIHRDSTIIVKDIFPYKKYINYDNWKTVSSINNDLAILDSINPNHFNNLDALVNALTIKNTFWYSSSLDSLNMLLVQWVDKFNNSDSLLNKVVFNYWMNQVALRLDSLQKENEKIKYSFQFKFLKERCAQSGNFANSTPDDSFTKIVNNIIWRKWHYLICERFWKSTSIPFKIVVFAFMIFTLWGYLLIFSKIQYYFSSKNK